MSSVAGKTGGENMLVGTVLYATAPGNLSEFTNHLIAEAMNSLLHLQVESKIYK
jgi:hypothetical protein